MKRRMIEGSDAFRAELVKLMPGYSWTVHKSFSDTRIEATGSQSSGFNRLSTLSVVRTNDGGGVMYEAKSAGYGLKAPWKHRTLDRTLARALRQLQDHYEQQTRTYRVLADDLEKGRRPSDRAMDGEASGTTELEWRVHTAHLLRQVLDNPGTGILARPLQIMGRLLAEVGERAAKLNDPELNKLMVQLTVYSMADPESKDYDPKLVHQIMYGGAK